MAIKDVSTGAIDDLIAYSTQLIRDRQSTSDKSEANKILFFGNVNDSYPRALIVDGDLSPRDKLTWQMLRLHSMENNGAVFPTYDELQVSLSQCRNSGQKASRKSVSDSLKLLRLTRWLSLCKTVRDPDTGIVLGNVYALHDEPLSFTDAMRFDPTYCDLVKKAYTHRNTQMQYIAEHLIQELENVPTLSLFYSQLSMLEARAKRQLQGETQKNTLNSGRELSEKSPSSLGELSQLSPSSITELSPKSLSAERELSKKALNSKAELSEISTVCHDPLAPTSITSTSIYIKTSTSVDEITLPPEFHFLSDKEKALIYVEMKKLSPNLATKLLDEAVVKWKKRDIKSLSAYLISMFKKQSQSNNSKLIKAQAQLTNKAINTTQVSTIQGLSKAVERKDISAIMAKMRAMTS